MRRSTSWHGRGVSIARGPERISLCLQTRMTYVDTVGGGRTLGVFSSCWSSGRPGEKL